MDHPSFEGKAVLVTGAAGGIGRATAAAFGRAGARLVVADVDVDGGEETAHAIRAGGGQATFVRADVTVSGEVRSLVAQTVARYGRLDCAFNNAGIEEENAKLAKCEEETFDRILRVNVKGVWLCMKYQIEQMLAHGGGVIVNTASVAGLVGAPRMSAYAASKHAVVGLTKSAAVEYASAGIRINAVCPGVIRTPMWERAIAREPKRAEGTVKLHPMGRVGEVEEVASAVLWLCSPGAGFVTGHQLAVDGGLTAI